MRRNIGRRDQGAGVEPSLSTLITEGNSTVINMAKKDKYTKSVPPSQGGRVAATFVKYDMRDFFAEIYEPH